MNRYGKWVMTLLCWDGALPLMVFSIPMFLKLMLPGRQGLMEVTAIVVPFAAFLIRGARGFKRHRNGEQLHWQTVLFAVAILCLALADTVFILFETIPNIAQGPDWYIVGILYFVYLTLMAFALFPARYAFGTGMD